MAGCSVAGGRLSLTTILAAASEDLTKIFGLGAAGIEAIGRIKGAAGRIEVGEVGQPLRRLSDCRRLGQQQGCPTNGPRQSLRPNRSAATFASFGPGSSTKQRSFSAQAHTSGSTSQASKHAITTRVRSLGICSSRYGGTGRPILISVREEPARSSLSPVWRDRGRGGLTNECRSEFFAKSAHCQTAALRGRNRSAASIQNPID